MPADMADMAALPDDVEALRAIIAAQAAELAAKDDLIGTLRLQLNRLRRQQFGRFSERLDRDIAQLELALEDLEAEQAAVASAPPSSDNKGRAAPDPSRPARRPLPDHLPRHVVEHSAPASCPACGGSLRRLGEDVTGEAAARVSPGLGARPVPSGAARLPPVLLPPMRGDLPGTGAQPAEPADRLVGISRLCGLIRRGRASPGLLAHVLVSKYADHLPLCRQAEILARAGVELSRSTLADWL